MYVHKNTYIKEKHFLKIIRGQLHSEYIIQSLLKKTITRYNVSDFEIISVICEKLNVKIKLLKSKVTDVHKLIQENLGKHKPV